MSDEAPAFVPTKASEYPVIRDQDIEMPSGAKVRVRKPSVWALLRTGQVPEAVRELLTQSDLAQAGEADPLTETETMTILNFLVAASFVEPKVSTARKKGCVYIDDIPDDDRFAVVKALGLKEVI